jgi:hypothetical protein
MKSDDKKTITLPSGKSAEIRKPLFKDQRLASRHANPVEDPFGFLGALVASTTTIDGNPVTPEDVDELSAADVNALTGELDLGNSAIARMSSNSRS